MILYLLYIILSPLLLIIVLFLSFFNSKIRKRLLSGFYSREKSLKHILKYKNNRKLILFHAASAGEFEQLKPILIELKNSKYYILQTFFSPTIYDALDSNDYYDSVCYHPFDFPWSAFLFFYRFQPDYYIITRHDIWPTHLVFSKLFGVKTILINANIYNNSKRLNIISIIFNRFIFQKFDIILTGSKRLKKLLSKLTDADKIIITGDSRFDQVVNRKTNLNISLFPSNYFLKKTVIFGSIDRMDISIISSSLNTIKSSGRKILIVPHEINKKIIFSIESMLKELDISSCMYSNLNDSDKKDCIIVDIVGILADLYQYSSIAYIGAGFSTGVHSVIEPAVYGNAVIFGPNIDLLDEAVEMYKEGIGIMVRHSNDLIEALENIINDKKKSLDINKDTKKYVSSKCNASEKIIKEIFKL